LFFTVAATKLPSYWIPATPAAGLLIACSAMEPAALRGRRAAWIHAGTLLLVALFSAGLAASPLWIPLIHEPELPTLPAELLASGGVLRAAVCFGLAAVCCGQVAPVLAAGAAAGPGAVRADGAAAVGGAG
jgi:4-amino-4-deoxy-L-arabinose transferase-like glycosyltransferase